MRNTHQIVLASILAAMLAPSVLAQDGAREKTPLDDLPPYIKRVTHFGQRADWSHDGQRILFLSKTFGDACEVELATGVIRPMTHHFSRGIHASLVPRQR